MQEEHKNFAQEGQSAQSECQDDVKHHFTAFVINAAGQLIELDGLKKGPVVICENCSGDVLRDSVVEIRRRLEAEEITESLSVMTLNAL